MAGLDSGFIVVGFDGTAESIAAVRWALARAAGMQVSVKIVHCWPPLPLSRSGRRPYRAEAVQAVENEISSAQRLVPQPPYVSTIYSSAPVESVLAAQARAAGLLVLGASSPAVLRDPARGPVAGPCLDRVSCPIVVVDGRGRVATARPRQPLLGLAS